MLQFPKWITFSGDDLRILFYQRRKDERDDGIKQFLLVFVIEITRALGDAAPAATRSMVSCFSPESRIIVIALSRISLRTSSSITFLRSVFCSA